GLHQHALARRDVKVRPVEDLLGASRLAVRDRPALHLLRADEAAERNGENCEGDPPEGGRLPVRSAPTARPAGEIGGLHRSYPFRPLCRSEEDTSPDSGIQIRTNYCT